MRKPRILYFLTFISGLLCYVFCEETEPIQATVGEITECRVEFKLELPDKPEGQHKAPPRSPHHAQAPVLTVGVYQWVELQCTCCCTEKEEQIKRAAARVAAMDQSTTRASTANYTIDYEEPIEVALGIGSWFGLDEDQAYGLFVVATVPGGGLAYLFTYLVHGERHLSAALSLMTSLLDTGTSVLWTFGVGWFWFERPMQMDKAVGWLLLIAVGQALGTIMRGCRPSVAHGILTWITRPLLLLAGILMVTLGVYINHYAFTEFNQNLIFSLLFLITFGFALGWIAGQITGQEITITRALGTEAAVFNGLLCIPLLRTTVHAPEGDLAAIVAVWATFFVPIPLIYHGIVSVVHHWITDYCQRRKKQNEQNAMSAIIANAAGDGTDLGAASVAAVAAAAIAVAPAIAAGPKEARQRGTQPRTHDSSAEGFVNVSECSVDLFETRRDSSRRSEHEHIPLSHTPHDQTADQPLVPLTLTELDMNKHNPDRLRNHVPGLSKPHKSQSHLPKTTHTEDQVLPYLLSDYDPRSVGKQMAYAQHIAPMQHRQLDEPVHGYTPVKPHQAHRPTHEKHKPPPYTNL
ncbi:unnamed protein product [Echinostoma caproni]|uniref:Na_H_Exchanger domain-containing protein n=1 Tax=Echinostoma caproni TaxID=27848 RepID=A0A183AMF7_9TREM|nr:unnamed protein product [Echinostoma caproni]